MPTPLTRMAVGGVAGVWLHFVIVPRWRWWCFTVLLLLVVLLAGWNAGRSLRRKTKGRSGADGDPPRGDSVSPPGWLPVALPPLILMAIAFAWAGIRGQGPRPLADWLPDGTTVQVQGTVASSTLIPKRNTATGWDAIPEGDQRRWELKQVQLRYNEQWHPVDGRIVVYLEDRKEGSWQRMKSAPGDVGQRLKISGRFRWPRSVHNPAEFDVRQWLLEQGIVGQLNARQTEDITLLSSEVSWWSSGDRLKDYFRRLVRQRVGEDQQAVASAVLLGDRSLLGPDIKQQYAATGTVHILAISGLHVGILVAVMIGAGLRLGIRRTWVFCAVIALVLFYAWLVQFRAPIVRAAVLTIVFCMAGLIHRRSFSINSLSAAAVVLLFLQPWQLLQPGTHLSFLAVATLVIVHRLMGRVQATTLERMSEQYESLASRTGKRIRKNLLSVYAYSTAVFLVCLPMVVHYFHLAAWVGILINPVVMIPMTFALVFGFLMLLMGTWFPWGSQWAGWGCQWSLYAVQQIVEHTYQWPGSHQYLASPGVVWVVAWYLGLLLVCWGWGRRIGPRRILIVFFLLFLVMHAWPYRQYPERMGTHDQLTITFVDVGHGNCTIVRTAEGRVLVCDAGSFPSSQAAVRKISSVLWAHGIEQIDDLVLSHADLDHYNAVPELIKRFRVGKVWVGPDMFAADGTAIRNLELEIKSAGIDTRILSAGDPGLIESYGIQILSPPRNVDWQHDNDRSLVLQLDYSGHRVLLTGDLEGEGLEHVLALPAASVSVLLVPHHGSRKNRPLDVVRWCQPQWAVISALESRVAKEVMDGLDQQGITVVMPSRDGALLLNLFEDGQIRARIWDQDPWPIR